MTNSTMTLAELKTRAEDLLDLDSDSDLTDRTVVIAVDDYLQAYIPEEQRVFPENTRLNATVTIPTTGYTISSLTDIGSTSVGFRVWKTTAKGQRYFPVTKNSQRFGYEIDDGKIKILPTPSSAEAYYIEYMPKITQFDFSTTPDMSATILPVLIGAEKGAEQMVVARYLERDQSEPQRAINYRNMSLDSISTFFATHAGFASYN